MPSLGNWQNTLATPEEVERILDQVETGLRDGGIGIGINAGYAPGYGRKEYYALAQLAARHEVTTFTHVRYISVIEPLSAFEALEEFVALSSATGVLCDGVSKRLFAASGRSQCRSVLGCPALHPRPWRR